MPFFEPRLLDFASGRGVGNETSNSLTPSPLQSWPAVDGNNYGQAIVYPFHFHNSRLRTKFLIFSQRRFILRLARVGAVHGSKTTTLDDRTAKPHNRC
jgi:hypothetical protein